VPKHDLAGTYSPVKQPEVLLGMDSSKLQHSSE
jgi:hypothetical protein